MPISAGIVFHYRPIHLNASLIGSNLRMLLRKLLPKQVHIRMQDQRTQQRELRMRLMIGSMSPHGGEMMPLSWMGWLQKQPIVI